LYEEQYDQNRVKGTWRDIIRKKLPDGTIVETRTDWKDNLIVENFGVLVAALLANSGLITGGALYHAVGRANSANDPAAPDPGLITDTTLEDEIFRKAIDSIKFLDPSDNPVVGPTNKIELETTFEFGEVPPGNYIREQGLFGGTATATADSGLMIDTIKHIPIWKDPSIELVRRIRLEIVVT